MNGPTPDYKNPAWWSKMVVQAVLLYNSIYHKNIDPNIGVGLVAGLEALYHAFASLLASAHAIKDAIKPTPVVPSVLKYTSTVPPVPLNPGLGSIGPDVGLASKDTDAPLK